MRHNRRFLRYLTGCMAALCLVSCSSPDFPASREGQGLDKNRVPFVRPLPLVVMREPIVVEFELPPSRSGGSDALVIGLRTSGGSRLESGEISRTVARAEVVAQVELERIDEAVTRSIPLLRREPRPNQPSETVAVADGHVSRAWVVDVDWASMREAGLVEADYTRDHLEFAWTRNAEPGRYRLSVQIKQIPPELQWISSELLVAYSHQPK